MNTKFKAIVGVFLILVWGSANAVFTSRFKLNNCTYGIDEYFSGKGFKIDWGGNANLWFDTSKALGYKVHEYKKDEKFVPKLDSIIVFSETTIYTSGHVGYISNNDNSKLSMTDMNGDGKELHEWRTRLVLPFSESTKMKIKGYIDLPSGKLSLTCPLLTDKSNSTAGCTTSNGKNCKLVRDNSTSSVTATCKDGDWISTKTVQVNYENTDPTYVFSKNGRPYSCATGAVDSAKYETSQYKSAIRYSEICKASWSRIESPKNNKDVLSTTFKRISDKKITTGSGEGLVWSKMLLADNKYMKASAKATINKTNLLELLNETKPK